MINDVEVADTAMFSWLLMSIYGCMSQAAGAGRSVWSLGGHSLLAAAGHLRGWCG